MRQQLLDLNEVQKIDLAIREIENGRQGFTDRLGGLEQGVQLVRTRVQELTDLREVNVREAKQLEATVQAENLKVRKWEARLNEIRNQREYLALSREVEGSKRQNRDTEEKILELMTAREALDKELDELQDKLAEEEVDYASDRETIEREVKDTDELVAAETKRREELLPKIPKNLLRKYDQIRQKRLGVGLVPVVNGCCQGCNMRLPPQLYNILQRGDSIEQCPSCFRIIFWEEILEQAETGGKESVEASP